LHNRFQPGIERGGLATSGGVTAVGFAGVAAIGFILKRLDREPT
jgi:hypothetical protein